MKILKPYYKRGNKYFYKKGKLRMTITRTGVGNYVFDGDIIIGKIMFPIITKDTNLPDAKIEIKVYD